MSSPPNSIPINSRDLKNSNRTNNNDSNSSSSPSSSSAFQGASSPFRQASVRLGSPVPSLDPRGLTGGAGLSPVQRPLGDDEADDIEEDFYDDNEVAIEDDDDNNNAAGAAQPAFDSRSIMRRGSPALSFNSPAAAGMIDSSGQSVRSIDIENPDPEVVKVVGRHLVKDTDSVYTGDNENSNNTTTNNESHAQNASSSSGNAAGGSGTGSGSEQSDVPIEDRFASLKLQGGDITRQLYNWQREHEEGGESSTKRGRSRSFDIPRPLPKGPNNEAIDIKNIKAPGGFRRNFLWQKAQDEDPESLQARPAFFTRNFIEFLSIYGHFAGEYLEEEEDDDENSSQMGTDTTDDGEAYDDERLEQTERTALLRRPVAQRTRSRRKSVHQTGNATPTKVVMLLLKSFVGTGVLFLPHAFLNGGILFSSLILTGVSALSYWCFLLLIRAKNETGVGSFGDVGGVLYGPKMRQVILASIVLSQIGFSAAYFVFTSENLQALILAWTNNQTKMSIESLIVLQMIFFLPLSWIRDIAKLSGTALIADFFIFLGLLYLYFWGARTLAVDGISDIKLFNKDMFTLFIGTAIFTYEGVGLIIPIQESMREPHKFAPVLGGVMVAITFIFVSMGALSYAAYGSETKTVVILNLPQDSGFVNGIQLLYSLAIVLSTPLQLFPAIRILENGLFVRSGKYNKKVKWQKNAFRFLLVLATALIAWIGADDLDKFVSLTGSFACIPLVYIYPPLLHLKACGHKSRWGRIGDITLCVLGFGAMIYTTSGTLKSWIGPE